jgi:Cu-Zn family superoxide dismutase
MDGLFMARIGEFWSQSYLKHTLRPNCPSETTRLFDTLMGMKLSARLFATMLLTIPGVLISCSTTPSSESTEAPSAAAETNVTPRATAELKDGTGKAVGTATFTADGSGVLLSVSLEGLPAGEHAIHVHETGACDAPDFKTAGGHFNPEGKQHGLENPMGSHAGDMPNFTVDADGKASIENRKVSASLNQDSPDYLLKSGGTALVIHAGPDDQKTDPSGDAGARIACGVIR